MSRLRCRLVLCCLSAVERPCTNTQLWGTVQPAMLCLIDESSRMLQDFALTPPGSQGLRVEIKSELPS